MVLSAYWAWIHGDDTWGRTRRLSEVRAQFLDRVRPIKAAGHQNAVTDQSFSPLIQWVRNASYKSGSIQGDAHMLRHLSVTFMLLTLVFHSIPALAQNDLETVEIKGFKNAQASQRAVVWCWAACIEMVVNHMADARVVLQEQIVVRNYGALAILPAFSFEQIRRTSTSWSLIRRGSITS
jgi:hypothetical protein